MEQAPESDADGVLRLLDFVSNEAFPFAKTRLASRSAYLPPLR